MYKVTQKKKKKKRKENWTHIQICKGFRKPYIVTESAVFRKNMPNLPIPMAYSRYSWTSYFRDEGDYCNENSPAIDGNKLNKTQNLTVKDWRFKGE